MPAPGLTAEVSGAAGRFGWRGAPQARCFLWSFFDAPCQRAFVVGALCCARCRPIQADPSREVAAFQRPPGDKGGMTNKIEDGI